MHRHVSRHASWQELLSAPAPGSHIVQIYDSDVFLVAGVSYFASEGLQRGEAVLLTGTASHLGGVRRALAAKGVDPEAAERDGRLILSDANEGVAAILVHGTVDPARFQAAAGDAVARVSADPRFTGVRWWGEMTNVLCSQGLSQAALAAEGLGDAAAKKHGVRLFCSFLCDRFDPAGYEGFFREICEKHTHVIPAEDYVAHRLAVNRALAEVVGEIRGSLLQSLLSWNAIACDMPSSQALLFWLRDTVPDRFSEVLTRAKAYQTQESS